MFYFVLQDNFQVQAPRGGYIWRGDLTEGFLGYEFGGLILGGAYFRNFTVFIINIKIIVMYNNSEYSIPQTEQNPLQYRFGPPMALWHRGVKTVVEPLKRTPVNKNREYVVPYIEQPLTPTPRWQFSNN